MELKSQLENALKDAMRANDDVRKRSIRMALSSIKLAEIEKGGPLDEAGIFSILQKEIKSRRETILEAQKANRDDIVQSTSVEITVLETFLPPALSDEELEKLVRTAITETGAAAPADMGKVMKALLPRIQGRAANDRISQMVRRLLQS